MNILPYNNVLNYEIDYLQISKLITWTDPFYREFCYSYIIDEEITTALGNKQLIKVNPNIDHQDDVFLLNLDVSDTDKHIFRVASLVEDIRKFGKLNNLIEMDTFATTCGFFINDGHHRIRAAQYLGYDILPFSCSGDLDQLERLWSIAKVNI